MASSAVAGMVLEAWKDLDAVTAGLSAEDAERRIGTASPISWSVGHLATQVDSWVNVLFRGQQPHPLIRRGAFRFGAAGEPEDWARVQAASAEVREAARPYLESATERELAREVPYRGSFVLLQGRQVSLRYALMRIALHHYFHIGEIASARVSLGHSVGDYPGLLDECLD